MQVQQSISCSCNESGVLSYLDGARLYRHVGRDAGIVDVAEEHPQRFDDLPMLDGIAEKGVESV